MPNSGAAGQRASGETVALRDPQLDVLSLGDISQFCADAICSSEGRCLLRPRVSNRAAVPQPPGWWTPAVRRGGDDQDDQFRMGRAMSARASRNQAGSTSPRSSAAQTAGTTGSRRDAAWPAGRMARWRAPAHARARRDPRSDPLFPSPTPVRLHCSGRHHPGMVVLHARPAAGPRRSCRR